MKPISLWCAATLIAATRLAAAESEDDFLIFEPITDEPAMKIAPLAPSRPPPPAAVPSKRPLPQKAASVRVILIDLPEKSFATARLATLSGTAVQGGAAPEPVVRFEGATVGLEESLRHATTALVAKKQNFPDGVTLTCKTDSAYHGHEKDLGAVAAAVVLEAVGTGRALDSDAAFLGGVGEGGKVTAASRVGTRLRTLSGANLSVVGVPMVSEAEVRDLALMNELDVLVSLPVVSLVSLDDAIAIAGKAKPEKVARAFELFTGVREAALKSPVATLVKNAKVQQRLLEITTLMPGHLSARLLLMAGTGKLPGRITYATSQQAILRAAKPFWEVIFKHANTPMSNKAAAQEIKTVATDCGNVLQRMQARVHPTVERYLTATKAYLRAWNNFLDIPQTQQWQKARTDAFKHMGKLKTDIAAEKTKLEKAGLPVESP